MSIIIYAMNLALIIPIDHKLTIIYVKMIYYAVIINNVNVLSDA